MIMMKNHGENLVLVLLIYLQIQITFSPFSMKVTLVADNAPCRVHLHKLGLFIGDLSYSQCNIETKTAHHVLCEWGLGTQKASNIWTNAGKSRRIWYTSNKPVWVGTENNNIWNRCDEKSGRKQLSFGWNGHVRQVRFIEYPGGTVFT